MVKVETEETSGYVAAQDSQCYGAGNSDSTDGLSAFFACFVPNFPIEEFTSSRYWFVQDVDVSWKWRMEVACRDVVVYGKLFSKKAGLVRWEWYPDLVNYRCNVDDFDARYKEGTAGYQEKCAMDVLLQEGSMLSKDLNRMAGFGTDGLKGLDRVMANLQM